MSILKLYFGRKIPGLWKTSRKIALRSRTFLKKLGPIEDIGFFPYVRIECKNLKASTIRGIMRRIHRLGVIEHPEILGQLRIYARKQLDKLKQNLDDYYLTKEKVAVFGMKLSIIQASTKKLGLTDLAKPCSDLMDALQQKEKEDFSWQLALERLESGHPQIPEDLSGIRFVSSPHRFSKKEMDLIFNTPGRGLYTPVTDMPGYTDIASILKDLNERSPIFLVSLVRISENAPWKIKITFKQGIERGKVLSKTFDLEDQEGPWGS